MPGDILSTTKDDPLETGNCVLKTPAPLKLEKIMNDETENINDVYDAMRNGFIAREFDFQVSPDIADISTALSKAQGAMSGALKDSANPYFKSKYADLSAVWEDIRKPFADNGISVVQMPCEGVDQVSVITQLTHTSGQWMRSKLTMLPTKRDPQGIGSCITYARRYALAAMAGVYQIDDDGNKASEDAQISTEPVDMNKVKAVAKDAMQLVDDDSEDYSGGVATGLLASLSNDERIALQKVMKAAKPSGTNKTYYSVFRDHLRLEREAAE